MDPRIAEAFGELSERLTRLFTSGLYVVEKPYSYAWSDTYNINNANDLQRRGWLDVRQQLGRPARFIRLITNVNCTLHITKLREPEKEIRITETIVAGIPVIITDEEVVKMRFEPVAYPFTIDYYISG